MFNINRPLQMTTEELLEDIPEYKIIRNKLFYTLFEHQCSNLKWGLEYLANFQAEILGDTDPDILFILFEEAEINIQEIGEYACTHDETEMTPYINDINQHVDLYDFDCKTKDINEKDIIACAFIHYLTKIETKDHYLTKQIQDILEQI